jgi:hypothetical protein
VISRPRRTTRSRRRAEPLGGKRALPPLPLGRGSELRGRPRLRVALSGLFEITIGNKEPRARRRSASPIAKNVLFYRLGARQVRGAPTRAKIHFRIELSKHRET